MDKRVFRMAVLTMISAFILVLVIVYATNASKINKLFGWGDSSDDAANVASSYSSEQVYGDQIGDDLDGFLNDEEFFDETEKVQSVVVIKKSSSSTDDSAEAGSLGSSGDDAEGEEEPGSGMAVVGELTNPNAPGAYMSGYEYNGVMPTAPQGGAAPGGQPGGTQVGTPPAGN